MTGVLRVLCHALLSSVKCLYNLSDVSAVKRVFVIVERKLVRDFHFEKNFVPIEIPISFA